MRVWRHELVSRIHWDARGIVLRPSKRALLTGRVWETQGLSTIALEWGAVRALRATDDWPVFEIDAHEPGVGLVTHRVPETHVSAGPLWSEPLLTSYGEHVDQLFEAARRIDSSLVPITGWRREPLVPWQPYDRLPGERSGRSSGPYRAAARPAEQALARWDAPLGSRALSFLFPEREGDEPLYRVRSPDSVVLSSEHVYVRVRRSIARLPLSEVRMVTRELDASGLLVWATYVWGRRAELHLLPAAWDEVGRVLDGELPARRIRSVRVG